MILIVYMLWFGWYLFALIVNATCFFVDCLGCGFGLICSQ